MNNLFLQDTPLIDVRAPCEFSQGHLPGAVNLPILTDSEREQVGTTYKKLGSEAAIELGHELVSGEIKKERVKKWSEFVQKNPKSVLYCFRGGLRSQITQKWLAEEGLQIPLIEGGYKRARHFLQQEMNQALKRTTLLLLSGTTGSHKTNLLRAIQATSRVLDLEALANHRGSAFGGYESPQPAQTTFENYLSVNILKSERQFSKNKTLIVEDESLNIGKCMIPKVLFEHMRLSPVVLVQEPVESRVENIFKEYVSSSDETQFLRFKKSLQAISKRLGGVRFQEILTLMEQAEKEFQEGKLETNKAWIEKLLVYYYDPLYLRSLKRREVVIAFQGTYKECLSYLGNMTFGNAT